MYLSKIQVTLRPSILDPQGKAVSHAIASLGMTGVREVRMGKYIEMKLDGLSEVEARKTVEDVCNKLLANPVMEDYHFQIEKL
jgi:phosphoribosylformylglycinamidine synthase subunit PurS